MPESQNLSVSVIVDNPPGLIIANHLPWLIIIGSLIAVALLIFILLLLRRRRKKRASPP